jgi:hypothetical protein
VATGGGSPATEVLLEGDTNVTVEEVAAGDPAGSTGPAGGASSSTVAVNDGTAVESEVILGHPMLRAPRDVSLDGSTGTAPLGAYPGLERAPLGEWKHHR